VSSTPPPTIPPVTEDYIRLGLRLGRHVDGLVDSYYGPAELQQDVDAEPLRDPAVLVDDARKLLDSGDGWLRHQVVGLETVARKLAGEEIPYADEVERCYGVRPRGISEQAFEAAHRELERVLPGDGSLRERYESWREENPVPAEQLPSVLESLAAELRSRTQELFGLPEGEQAELEYVSGEPWSAYNNYVGGLRSRIEINLSVPMVPNLVTELIAHEIYPGHHTEHAWKEQLLVREQGRLEESILMIGAPQSLIAEGIAKLAPEIVVDDQDALTAERLSRFGIDYDASTAAAIRRARAPLERVGANAALLLYEDGLDVEEARTYLRRWALMSDERADRALRFITHPVWRSYVSTYDDGYELCSEWVAGDPAKFKRLLTEQLSPADLLASR
jgi:hypothetical protein